MSRRSSASPEPLVDPAKLATMLRCHLCDLSSSAAFLLQAGTALDTEFEAGGDGLTLLSVIEQQAARYAAAHAALGKLAPAIDRLLSGIGK